MYLLWITAAAGARTLIGSAWPGGVAALIGSDGRHGDTDRIALARLRGGTDRIGVDGTIRSVGKRWRLAQTMMRVLLGF